MQLKLDFYGKLKLLSEKGVNKALKQIRAIILENFDAAWRRYLLLMNNAKDIVAFQRYTDKDPLVSYYNIAQSRFSEIMYDAMLGYIKDLISMRIEPEDRVSEINFDMLREYLFERQEKDRDLDLFLEENSESAETPPDEKKSESDSEEEEPISE
jgi:preprotein translocase subunit SecA